MFILKKRKRERETHDKNTCFTIFFRSTYSEKDLGEREFKIKETTFVRNDYEVKI